MLELLHDYNSRCALSLFVLNLIMFICVAKSWFYGARAKTSRRFLWFALVLLAGVAAHTVLTSPL